MNQVTSSWSEEKFKAYVMVYAAQTDHVETEDEKDYLESNFDKSLLKEVYKEINQDNDFNRIQKIMSFVKSSNYSENSLKDLLVKIKKMYMCDGNFGSAEQLVYSSLQKLFNVS